MGGRGRRDSRCWGGGELSSFTLHTKLSQCPLPCDPHTHIHGLWGKGWGKKEGRKGRGTRIRGQEEQDIKILNKKWGTGKDEERGYRGGGEERGRSGDFVTLPHFFFETLA